ncbi:hypothetical protein OAG85_01400 [Verrucomicrobiales bacterium]|nr:hypothetical protein [Verrucomicrobiales bacterium]MDA7525928.1 hypothetical protein [Verrucomicrobiales bacterium]MDB4808564.1 hypothetical protein [Verrucomicrobiales bacterium]
MTNGFHQLLCMLGIISFLVGFSMRRQVERPPAPEIVDYDPRVPPELRKANAKEFAEAYRHHTDPDTFEITHLASKEHALWQWIELDGESALSHATECHNGARWHLTDSPNSILQRWAWRAPKTAMRAALQIEDRQERTQTLGAILDRLAQLGDLDAAIATASQVDELNKTGRQFLEAWALQDSEAAGNWFGQLRHPESGVGIGWSHQLPTGMVLHAFATLKDHWGRQAAADRDVISVLTQILEGEARESPKVALQWLSKLSPALLDQGVINGVIRGWASHSPEKALSFIENLPNNFSFLETKLVDLSYVGKIELARAWSQADPKNAARWILALSPETQKPLLDVAAKHFVNHDLAWANQILQTDEEEHPVVVGEWVSQLAKEMPETAAARLLDHLEDPAYVGSFAELAQTWHGIDSERCARFVTNLNPGPNRDAAASGIIKKLLESPETDNLESARSWLATLQPGATRTVLVTNLVEVWTKIDPKAAQEAQTSLKETNPERPQP